MRSVNFAAKLVQYRHALSSTNLTNSQTKLATLKIFFILFCGPPDGGVIRYLALKSLLFLNFLNLLWGVVFIACVAFSVCEVHYRCRSEYAVLKKPKNALLKDKKCAFKCNVSVTMCVASVFPSIASVLK